MTNEQIIFSERMQLMREGKIGTTGRMFVFEDADGNKTTVQEPEEIHTFQAWKALGFKVKKGEHAVAKFTIWKCRMQASEATGKDVETGELVTYDTESKRMFMKTAAFFSPAQVEAIEARAV